MSYRVTVKIGRLKHAEAEVALRDPNDDRDVEDAAKRVCKAKHKTWPNNPNVVVAEHQGRSKGWVPIRTLTL